MELRSLSDALLRVRISSPSALYQRQVVNACCIPRNATARDIVPKTRLLRVNQSSISSFHSSTRSHRPERSSPDAASSSPLSPPTTPAATATSGNAQGRRDSPDGSDWTQKREQAAADLGWDLAGMGAAGRRDRGSSTGMRASSSSPGTTSTSPPPSQHESSGSDAQAVFESIMGTSRPDPYGSAYGAGGSDKIGPVRPFNADPFSSMLSPLDRLRDVGDARTRVGGLTRGEQAMQQRLQQDVLRAPRGRAVIGGDRDANTLKLGPRVGRTIRVSGQNDVGRAISSLEMALARNKVRSAFVESHTYERAGAKAKRLRRQRWRVQFKKGFVHTIQRVMEIRGMGWH